MRHILSALSVLTTLTLTAQVPSYVPTNGLVGWWPFNGNANDESGNGNNGTVNGAILTSDRFGIANAAYEFNGAGNNIQLGSNPFVAFDNLDGSDFTVSLWYNLDTVTNCVMFQNMGTQGYIHWGMMLSLDGSNNNPLFAHVGILPDDNWYPVYTNSLMNENNWYQIIGVKEGSLVKIYINGVLINTANSNPAGLRNAVWVGGNVYDGGGWVDGVLDDIGIWNRALTPAEIQDLYLAGQPSTPCVSPTAVSFSGLGTSYTTSDGPAMLTGTPAGGVFIGPGVTGSTFSPAVAGEGTHSISYTYLDGNNCVNTFSLCTSVAIGMGVEPGGNALGGVRVFPNPNRGQFIVELDLNGLVGMQVFDARGALVHNEVFTASGSRTQRTLDLSAFAKGSYTLLVEHNGQRVSQRVVVE